MSVVKLRGDYKKLRDSYHELTKIWDKQLSWHKWLIRQQRLFKLRRIRTFRASARVRVRHARKKQKRPTIIFTKKIVKTRKRLARVLRVSEPRRISMKTAAKYGMIFYVLTKKVKIRIDHMGVILFMGSLKYFNYSDIKYARIQMGGTFTQNSMGFFLKNGIIHQISTSQNRKIYSLTAYGNVLYSKCYNFISAHIAKDVFKNRDQSYYKRKNEKYDAIVSKSDKNTE